MMGYLIISSKETFLYDHPLWVGPIGYMGSKAAMNSLAEADVILALGTRLSVFGTLPQYDVNYFPDSAKIIQVDINPRNLARTHPVEVGIIGDAKEAAVEILRRLEIKIPTLKVDHARMDIIQVRVKEWRNELVRLAMVEGVPINPRRALLEIQKFCPKMPSLLRILVMLPQRPTVILSLKERVSTLRHLPLETLGFPTQQPWGRKWLVPRPLSSVSWGMGHGA